MCTQSIELVLPFLRHSKLDADTRKMHTELAAIFNRAAELSLSIWTHKQEIWTEGIAKHKFKYADQRMEAHQLHSAALDQKKSALDGSPIILLTQPVISLRVHKDEGKSTTYILKRAVCFLGEK